MMMGESSKFLCPTKLFRELNMLVLIGEHPWMSQHSLAKQMGITSAMANFYMKDLICKKMVVAEGENNRAKRYFLTPKGRRRRRNLLNEYITGVSDLYSTCKKEFEQRLQKFIGQGIRRVVFFGAAETCEIAYHAAPPAGMEIVGIVDNDPEKHHRKMGDVEVRPPDSIEELSPDGVVITALAHTDEIYEQLSPLRVKGIPVKRL
jgi:DNA-binding MarR family transcriptional regulator